MKLSDFGHRGAAFLRKGPEIRHQSLKVHLAARFTAWATEFAAWFGMAPAHSGLRVGKRARSSGRVLMNRRYPLRKSPSQKIQHMLLLVSVVFTGCGVVKGQATGQYSGGSSVAAGNTSQSNATKWTPATPAKEHSTPTHLPASASPAPEIANRQAIEQRAGKDGAKLLLRSVPSGARVWIDGAFVGNTPTLLLVAPGRYLLEMRGERFDFAARVINALPSETRDVTLQLAVRYPTRVSTR